MVALLSPPAKLLPVRLRHTKLFPTSKPGTGQAGAGIRREGIHMCPGVQGEHSLGEPKEIIYHLTATRRGWQEKTSHLLQRKQRMDHSVSDYINELGEKNKKKKEIQD